MELIKERVEGEYYTTLEMFAADFRLMFNNCRLYNARHRLLQVCHQARGVLREQGAGGHQLERARGDREGSRALDR